MPRPAHYETPTVRVEKLIVGPFENNVFVVRCTGHRRGRHHRRRQRARAPAPGEQGHRRAARAHHARPLRPHPGGGGGPQRRHRRRHRARRRVDAAGLRLRDPRRRGHRGRRPAPTHHPKPRSHRGVHVLPARGTPPILFSGDTCSPAAPATPRSQAATSSRSSSRSTAGSSPSPPTCSCSPATASTPRSARSGRTCRSGSNVAGELSPRQASRSSRTHVTVNFEMFVKEAA